MIWDTDFRGNVVAFPLAAYDTNVVSKTNCGVRFVLMRSDDTPASASMVFQMQMTVSQANALVKDLQRMIAEILATRSLSRNIGPEQPSLTEMAKGVLTSKAAALDDESE